jgi:hypothetical protein
VKSAHGLHSGFLTHTALDGIEAHALSETPAPRMERLFGLGRLPHLLGDGVEPGRFLGLLRQRGIDPAVMRA